MKHKSKGKGTSLRDVYEDDLKNKDKGSGNRVNYLDVSGYDDLDFYKIKKDKNKIRIVPYRVTTDNHPTGREKGETDYKLEIYVHRYFGDSEGNYICMKETYGKPCPGCKELKKMIDSKEYTWKDKEVQDIKPKRRDIFLVKDLMEDDDKLYILDVSQFEFLKKILEEAERGEDGFVPFADPEEGKAIIFYGIERDGKDFKNSFKPDAFRFKDDDPIDEDEIDEAPSLDAMIVIPDYDEMEKDLYGISGDADDDDEDEKPSKKRKSKSSDDDDDEPEDEDEEEDDESSDDDEEEENDDDDDEPEDDDEDEEDEKPVKKRTRKIEDDDDEDEPSPKKQSGKKVRKASKDEDEEDEDEKPAAKKKGKQKCPSGHKFGEDCDEYPKDCKKCKLFNDCADAFK